MQEIIYKIEVSPDFIYELCRYKHWKNGSSLEFSKTIVSKNPLTIKQSSKLKQYAGYSIEESVELIAAPEKYIKENRLFIINTSKCKKSRK